MACLDPTEVFPAGVDGVTTRMIDLATGIRVRVVEGGSPSGVPALLLHGWASSLYMFRHAFRYFPSMGIRPIAVDLRGHGLSEHPRAAGAYTTESYLADAEAILNVLELESAAIVGQSMGGGIALRYAIAAPTRVRRLALINPVGLVRVGSAALMRSLPVAVMAVGANRALPRWSAGFVLRHYAFGDPGAVSEQDVDENWAMTRVAGFGYAVRAAIREFNWAPLSRGEAASLAVPALVVLGKRDRVIRPSPAAAAALSGARVEVIDGGHCVHEEHPAEVYRLIGDHILAGSARSETNGSAM